MLIVALYTPGSLIQKGSRSTQTVTRIETLNKIVNMLDPHFTPLYHYKKSNYCTQKNNPKYQQNRYIC